MTLAIYCTIVFYPITIKYLQQERHVSLLSAAKNRIDFSHTDPVLQHFKSEKVLFHQTKLSAFCTLLKKPKFHWPISQKAFKIFKIVLHI